MSVYHETQWLALCLVHSFNNLLGKHDVSRLECDQICQDLSPQNPNVHRNAWGLGDYDINVLNILAMRRSLNAQWFDARKINDLKESEIDIGIILNFKPKNSCCPFIDRHWVAIRKVEDKWLDLDSKLWKPREIGDFEKLVVFLQEKIQSEDGQIFIIHTSESL